MLKVKYSNCNNSAADCSIALKFGTEFDHSTASTLQMFKIKVTGSKFKVTGSRVKVTV